MSATEIRRRIAEARARGASAEKHCREIMREVACEIATLQSCCKHENVRDDAWQYAVAQTCGDCGMQLAGEW